MKNKSRQSEPTRRATFSVRVRLIKTIEFKRVFRNSMVSSDRCFKVLALRNDSNCSRLGMAVSKQVDRHAVGRNRIKRVIRESFRQSFEELVHKSADKSNNGNNNQATIDRYYPGIDIVVLPRRVAATINNHQLFQSLQKHWWRLKQETGFRQETG